MKISLILLSVIFIFSCEMAKPKNGLIVEKADANVHSAPKNFKKFTNSDIKKLFDESFEEHFKKAHYVITERIKESYKLIKPFDLCEDLEIVRKANEDKKYWVDLIIYKFKPNEFNELKNYIINDNLKGEIIFGKDWDYILGIKNTLIRVNSGCTVSKQNWESAISSFTKKLKNEYEIDWDGYSCNCGLPCNSNK